MWQVKMEYFSIRLRRYVEFLISLGLSCYLTHLPTICLVYFLFSDCVVSHVDPPDLLPSNRLH
ncbi:hypothetical protein BDR07DRAFT_1437377 [Suillus spraguei]|nr:hypothetical protein BDR07DRAFT_1437367 [Suillus spraguei]KAG2352507.1 hypothetical protein BDR07DRAFT_1437377 [Suillus spraguei]